jgi:hypothetical protein
MDDDEIGMDRLIGFEGATNLAEIGKSVPFDVLAKGELKGFGSLPEDLRVAAEVFSARFRSSDFLQHKPRLGYEVFGIHRGFDILSTIGSFEPLNGSLRTIISDRRVHSEYSPMRIAGGALSTSDYKHKNAE